MSGAMDTADLTVPAVVRECLDIIDGHAGDAIQAQRQSYAAARELLLLFRRAGGSAYEIHAMADAVERETADAVPHLFDEVGESGESVSFDLGGAA